MSAFDCKFRRCLFCYLRQVEASHVGLVVKNQPATAGDLRDTGSTLGWEDPLEKGMATHSILLAWVDRGAWQATVDTVTKCWTQLKRLSMHIL